MWEFEKQLYEYVHGLSEKRALFTENLPWINQGLKSKETAYLDVERRVK